MSRLSKQKIEQIKSNVLAVLYENFPRQLFTSEISRIEARDEEFVKKIMFELKEKNLVVQIKKNEAGKFFVKRMRWQLSSRAYEAYHQKMGQ